MKLLFDQNISPSLVEALTSLYPGSSHVRIAELQKANEDTVWNFARKYGFTIVSKDSDFHQRSFLFGAPPKVIWIRRGNCSTHDIERILRKHQADIKRFHDDKTPAFLILS